jgi:iron complex transport system substrate-binding protein
MRIVSLLPSATESLFALGLGSSVVAVTHECDYPPEASSLPIVTRSTLRLHDKDSAGIEIAVSEAALAGRSLYFVDTQAIQDLEPDLVVAQDVCRVCAVSADQVAVDLEGVRMIRQHPHSLQDVLADIVALAAACGADATPLMSRLTARIEAARRTAHGRPPVRGVFLEWLDPPYPAGHWTPDLLALAGIDDPLSRPGAPSVAISWADVAAALPELLVLAPCGFNQQRAQAESDLVRADIESVGADHVVVLDGSAYFNRPGPRLVDSLELLVANR